MKSYSLSLITCFGAGAFALFPVAKDAAAAPAWQSVTPAVAEAFSTSTSATIDWLAPSLAQSFAAIGGAAGTDGSGTSVQGSVEPRCSTTPLQPVCSTLGIPSCSSFGFPTFFCSVQIPNTLCSAIGPGNSCSAAAVDGDGAKCSTRNDGDRSNFCSALLQGVCSSVSFGDCSAQSAPGPQHCSVILGLGGTCTAFDDTAFCSVRPAPFEGPGTCSVLTSMGPIPGMICSG